MRFEWTVHKLPKIVPDATIESSFGIDAVYSITLYRISNVALVRRQAIAILDFSLTEEDNLVWQGTCLTLDIQEINLEQFFQELSVASFMEDFQDLREMLVTPEKYTERVRNDSLRIAEYQRIPDDDKSQAEVYEVIYG